VNWTVRHQGSPQSIDNLSLAQVIEGLHEGLWEPTDEVMGPQDRQWQAIENHPQLAEVALDIEPPPSKPVEDETRLDMTPLIDVTLVLLIFFMLMLTYVQLQRAMAAGDVSRGQIKVVAADEVLRTMIRVTARPGADPDHPVVQVEKQQVDLDALHDKLAQMVKDEQKTILLIDATGVPESVVVAIKDAAVATGIREWKYARQKGAAPVAAARPAGE
jgi:biopolymer transport protein ExbD